MYLRNHQIRSLILQYCTDGANPFYGVTYSVWPQLIRVINLGPTVGKKRENLLLVGLFGGGKPKNMAVVQALLIDELIELYYRGVKTIDAFPQQDGQRSAFELRAKLINSVGDFPGNCQVQGISGAGSISCCPYCHIRGETIFSRRVYQSARRFLPDKHMYRSKAEYTRWLTQQAEEEKNDADDDAPAPRPFAWKDDETRPEPRHRTHASILQRQAELLAAQGIIPYIFA
jgi:hypothetical protein